MKQAQQHLTAYRGNDEPQVFDFFQDVSGDEQELPIASAFTSVFMQVRERRSSDSRLVFNKTLTNGITASDNRLTVNFTANELQGVSGGVYYYDLKVVRVGDNDKKTLFFGEFILTDNVTI